MRGNESRREMVVRKRLQIIGTGFLSFLRELNQILINAI